jgi:hypothetical protein
MDGTDSYSESDRTEYIDQINGEILFEMALPILEGLAYSDSECESYNQLYTTPNICPEERVASIDLQKARVRFQIPSTWLDQNTGLTVPFTGTYFKITYDILTTPEGWFEGWAGADRSFLADQTIVWTGPGTGAPDDPSWFTDWITIDPPSVPGTRRIVNVRFVCRENWFVGVVPQTTGEAVELPPP